MIQYSIKASVVHHTTDAFGISADVTVEVPEFSLSEWANGVTSEAEAEALARKIICPVELQYESLTVHVRATRVYYPL